jgi:hypothetical protein
MICRTRGIVLLFPALIGLAPLAVRGQAILRNDTTINFTIGNVWAMRNLQTSVSPTITLVQGANVGNLSAFHESAVNVKDGAVGGLFGMDDSRIDIGGGLLSSVDLADRSRLRHTNGYAQFITVREQASAALAGPNARARNVRVLGYDARLALSDAIVFGPLTVGGFNVGEIGGSAVMSGGSVEGGGAVRGDADLSVSGGNIQGVLNVSGSLDFGGGFIENIAAGGVGNASMTGGRAHLVSSGFRSTLDVSGGVVESFLDVHDSSTSNLYAGTVGDVVVWDDGTFNMFGGSIVRDLTVVGRGVANLYGGAIGGRTTPQATGAALSGGDAQFARFDSTAPIAQADTLDAYGDGILVSDDGLLSIFGYGLGSTLLAPDFDDRFSVYRLSGFLSDHTDMSGRLLFVENGGDAQFRLVPQGAPPPTGAVPEPGMLELLVVAGVAALVLGRRLPFMPPHESLGCAAPRARRRSRCRC